MTATERVLDQQRSGRSQRAGRRKPGGYGHLQAQSPLKGFAPGSNVLKVRGHVARRARTR